MALCAARLTSLLLLSSQGFCASLLASSDDLGVAADDVSLLQIGQSHIFKSSHDSVPVDKISARGHSLPAQPDLTPDKYVLSDPAAKFGINPSNAKLSGGGAEWSLFETGKAPMELTGDVGPEALQVNDPGDFCAGGDIAGYSILNVSDPTLVPFILPAEHPGRRNAAVIIAPGGGNRFLSWNKEGTQVAKWLNTIGISAFVLKYRTPTNSKETSLKPLIDSQRAISIVRHYSAKYGFKSIGLMGFSAGGFLAADVGAASKRRYAAIDAADIQSFRPDFSLLIYAASTKLGGPVNPPPTFIAVARNDPCVNPILASTYYAQLMLAGGGHEFHVYSAGKHGYGDCSLYVFGGSWKPVCAWTINAQLFIENILGVKRALGTMTLPEG